MHILSLKNVKMIEASIYTTEHVSKDEARKLKCGSEEQCAFRNGRHKVAVGPVSDKGINKVAEFISCSVGNPLTKWGGGG